MNKLVTYASKSYDYIESPDNIVLNSVAGDNGNMSEVTNVTYKAVSHGGEVELDSNTVKPVEPGWVEIQSTYQGLEDSVWIYIFPTQPTVDVNFGEYGDNELILNSAWNTDYTGVIMVGQEEEEVLNTYNSKLDVHSDIVDSIEGCTIEIIDRFTFEIKGITVSNIKDFKETLLHIEYKVYYDDNNYILALDKYIAIRV